MPRQVPQPILQAMSSMAVQFFPEASPGRLLEALEGLSRPALPDALPQTLTKTQYGTITHRSLASVNRDLRLGRLKFVKIGRSVRIPRTEVERLLAVGQEG